MKGVAKSDRCVRPSLRLRWLMPLAIAAAGLMGTSAVNAATPATAGVFVPRSFTLHLQNQTSTLLNDGTVLITGGVDGTGTVRDAAALYDPATGITTVLSNHMNAARQGHTATLLSDGRVLIAGGSTTSDPTASALTSAELYSPMNHSFTAVSSMSVAHALHSATLLVDGTVLVAGGYCGSTCTTAPGGGNSQAGISVIAEVFNPSDSSFNQVSNLRTTLVGHTATRLGDSTVLMVGGISAGSPGGGGSPGPTNGAEYYRPNSQNFANTGSMSDSRVSHTATLLNDGTVLITGGASGDNPLFPINALPSAEIYTPSSKTFALTPTTMTTPRAMHAAALLQDGTVLILSGQDDTQTGLANAEIYDPIAKTFTPVAAALDPPRTQFAATTLVDGTVLLSGGATPAGDGLQLALFDGTPGAFVRTGAMTDPRQFHTANMLSDNSGRVFIAGGRNSIEGALDSTELYDGATFTPGPDLSTGRYLHTATAFPNGAAQQVLITGGVRSGGVSNSAELYTAQAGNTGTIASVASSLSDSRFGQTATYLAPISGSTTIANGGVLVVGGEDAAGVVLKTTDLYVLDGVGGGVFNPNSRNPATKGAKPSGSHELATARVYHTATPLCDGTVLVAGGMDPTGNYLTSAELYNPTTDGFTSVSGGKTGGMISARAFHTAQLLLPSCNVLITGGVNAKGIVSTAELYIPGVPSSGKPTIGKFVALSSMNTAREQHTASLLPDGTVLLAGGKSATTTVEASGEIYDPILQTFSPAASAMLSPRVGHAAVPLNSGFVLLTGGEDDSFVATAGAELYDPPSGPLAAAASVAATTVSKKGGAGKVVNAGSLTISNASATYESVGSVTVALSDPSLFASLSASGKNGTAKVSDPGSSAELAFNPPLELAPGTAVQLKFGGKLAKHQRGATSVQSVTGIALSGAVGATTVGLPANLGSITEK